MEAGKRLRDRVLSGYQLYQGLRLIDDPYDLDRVLSISDTLLRYAKAEDVQKVMDGVRWSPDGVSAVEERYRLQVPDRRELLEKPKGSFGQAFGEFLETHGIDPRADRPPEVVDDLTYLAAHLSETHDIWHVVTGFPPTLDGEAGLAAFGAAQTGSPFQSAIVAGVMINALRDRPWEIGAVLEAISRGWDMGKRAKPFVGVRWERFWFTPLRDVRGILGLG
jgi:ubiquinone biosynthesis protein Coq4